MIHDSAEQSEQTDSNLKLGCYGWQHDSWQGSYYPDDLPPDWQLSYYANDFSRVLVPADYWQQDVDADDWLDEVHEQFYFYLQWPKEAALAEKARRACEQLQPQLAGIVVDRFVDNPGVKQYSVDSLKAEQKIWQPGISPCSSVGMLDTLQDADLRLQRSWLEQFDEASHHQAQTLFIMDVNCDHRQLSDMGKLIELMGL